MTSKKQVVSSAKPAASRRKFLKTAGLATAGIAASGLAAPAIAQGSTPMVIVSTWPRDFPGLGTGAQRCAANIELLSEGSIKVEYYAAGERVGAFDSFDAVASGNAQAYHGADYYWKGKHPAWAYDSGVPFGMTCHEINAWLDHMGGQALWDEVGSQFGVKCVAAGSTGVQMGGWFNKEINSPDDLKGLKMRIPGLGGDVMAKLGASPVSLPGGQIYENLVSGAIDATEWVGPWNDYFLKFYEAAKYYYYPGMHEPGSTLSLGMNASWWGSLTDHQKNVIKFAARSENDYMMSEFNANNGTYLEKLLTEHGVVLKRFNEDVYDAFGTAAQAVFEETMAHSDLAKRTHESFLASMQDVGSWMNIAEVAYQQERNRVLGWE